MGVHADEARAFTERVEEDGDLCPPDRAGPVMVLPADDNERFILPVSVTLARFTTPGTRSSGSACPFSTPSTVAGSWWRSARCQMARERSFRSGCSTG